MSEEKATTVSAVSAMATALSTAQGSNVVITLEDVRKHMDWVRSPIPSAPPLGSEKRKYISAAMTFLLSDNAPRA